MGVWLGEGWVAEGGGLGEGRPANHRDSSFEGGNKP